MLSITSSEVFCPTCNDTPSSIIIAEKGVILETRLRLRGSDYEAAGSHKTYEKRHAKILRCCQCGEVLSNSRTQKIPAGVHSVRDVFQCAG